MSLPVFPAKLKKRRIRMIDDKQRPTVGGGGHLASKTDRF